MKENASSCTGSLGALNKNSLHGPTSSVYYYHIPLLRVTPAAAAYNA